MCSPGNWSSTTWRLDLSDTDPSRTCAQNLCHSVTSRYTSLVKIFTFTHPSVTNNPIMLFWMDGSSSTQPSTLRLICQIISVSLPSAGHVWQRNTNTTVHTFPVPSGRQRIHSTRGHHGLWQLQASGKQKGIKVQREQETRLLRCWRGFL